MARSLIEIVKPFTKSNLTRLSSMRDSLASIDDDGIEGDVVECGVWRGGNIMLAMLMSPARRVWLYDTFAGMTRPDDKLDVKGDGERAIDRYNQKVNNVWDAMPIEKVKSDFSMMGLDTEKANFVIGPVEKTLMEIIPEKIALLRLDVDWHSPTKKSLEVLYPLLSPGGFLIVDDYGHWMGCKKAVDDFFKKKELPIYYDADYSCRVFRKPC